MAFPIPAILSCIEELLYEVHWLEGLILVTDSNKPTFVSITQLDSLLTRLKGHPKGEAVAEMLYMSLADSHGQGSAKTVLVLKTDGSYWAGLMDICSMNAKRESSIAHLNRCFEIM